MRIKPNIDKAFEKLFLEYFKPLTVFAWQKIQDRMLAEDVVQNVFAEIYEKMDSRSIKKLGGPYLYRAVHNRCLNEIKRRDVINRNQAAASVSLHPDPRDPFEEVRAIEFEHRYQIALEKLPPKCRKIFGMSRDEGMKNAEIAAELNLSVRTVETQISKAIRILRKWLITCMVLSLLLSSNFPEHGVRVKDRKDVITVKDSGMRKEEDGA